MKKKAARSTRNRHTGRVNAITKHMREKGVSFVASCGKSFVSFDTSTSVKDKIGEVVYVIQKCTIVRA